MRRILSWLFSMSLVSSAFAAAIVPEAPREGAVVPLLKEKQKAILALPHAARLDFFDDNQPKKRREIASCRSEPLPVRLAWRGGTGPFEVSVTKKGAARPFWRTSVATNALDVWNLEVGADYVWTVSAKGEKASGTFRTEDLAPRLIMIPKVPNIRDIGGRVGLDGRRIRQGLVYRSAGLNDNAKTIYYTLDEILQLEKEGKLAALGDLGAKYSRTLRAGKKLEPKYLRLIKSEPTEPGAERLTDETRAYLRETLGIRTDIDLRTDRECFGMTGSPLGAGVTWVHVPYHDYSSVHLDGFEDTRHLEWFTSFVRSFDKFPGETLSQRICVYFRQLGFTDEDFETIRSILLEDA